MKISRNDRGSAGFTTLIVGVVTVLVVGFFWFVGYISNTLGSTDGGHVAIVRNGGPFDNSAIRQVLPANSGLSNIGFASTMHWYPTSQRYFTISSAGNGDANESVTVPTADGINVGIEGTAYFVLNTESKNDYKVLKKFDNDYGTRSFKCTKVNSDGTLSSDGTKSVWQGDKGFSCFLDQVFSPIINNDLRQSIGDVTCADLVASCSLVQNSNATLDPSKVGQGNRSLATIEQAISSSLTDDLNSTLGGPYFEHVHFNLAKIDLPQQIQDSITEAQKAFAQVTKAQAAQKQALIEAQTRLKQAQIDAQANEARQKGYNNCPTCAQIDEIKSLPQGITVYAPGNGNVAIPAK